MGELIIISADELRQLSQTSLQRAGVPEGDAKLATEILVTADLQGIDTHGTKRLAIYINRIRKGLINPIPSLKVKNINQPLTLVDGDNGLGQVVAGNGIKLAIELAEKYGIAYVGCSNSNHFGPVAPYGLKACEKNLISIIGTNAFPSIAAWGSKDITVGNNPIGIGIPRQNGNHFILDMAMSVVARGKIRKAADLGEEIPGNWALDEYGDPTTDPIRALKGIVLPIGGHKGYGMALAVDVLSGVLTGAGYGTGVKSLFQQMEEPQHIGHFIIIIDPSRLIGLDEFYSRMEDYCSMVTSSKSINPNQTVLIPGEIEGEKYGQRLVEGIPYEVNDYNTLIELSKGIYNQTIHKM